MTDEIVNRPNGQIKKGEHLSPKTEFKKGQHWRSSMPYWNKDWLTHEYVDSERSTGEIAAQFNVTDAAIIFWLKKHKIPRRNVSQARSIKHWGLSGEANPMYGKTGSKNPRWKGGLTPAGQLLYVSSEWTKVERQVWRRDKGVCQRCNTHYTQSTPMHIHHIVSFEVVELRCELTNLLLLCETCHQWVHSNDNTEREFIRE